MPHGGINVPAAAGGASGGARQQNPPMYTVVVYAKRGKAVVIVYKVPYIVKIVMHREDAEDAAILRTIKTSGILLKRWQAGGAAAYVVRVPAAALDGFLPEELRN